MQIINRLNKKNWQKIGKQKKEQNLYGENKHCKQKK